MAIITSGNRLMKATLVRVDELDRSEFHIFVENVYEVLESGERTETINQQFSVDTRLIKMLGWSPPDNMYEDHFWHTQLLLLCQTDRYEAEGKFELAEMLCHMNDLIIDQFRKHDKINELMSEVQALRDELEVSRMLD